MKEKLLKYHQEHCTSKRINISKIVNEYQTKFDVPKCMIIKWLGLTTQKSLFQRRGYDDKADADSESDRSCESEDSNIEDNSELKDDFFSINKPKGPSAKEIKPLSNNIEWGSFTQKYSSGKISEFETSSLNQSDDQKDGHKKLQIRIKKSKFKERFQLASKTIAYLNTRLHRFKLRGFKFLYILCYLQNFEKHYILK